MAANPPQTPCVVCGTRLPTGSRFCDECGNPQPAEPPPAPPPAARKVGSQTVLGIASPVAHIPEGPQYLRASHPGFAPAPPPPAPLQHAAPAPLPVPQQQAPAPKKVNLGQTMVGMASLPGADRANAPLAAPPVISPPVAAAPHVPVAPQASKNIPKGTLMGVALPGIAPTHDPPPQPRFVAPPPYMPPPETTSLAPAGVPKPSRLPAIILGLVAVAAMIGVALYVFLRPAAPPAVTSSIEGDNKAPRLLVKCPTCADGSSIDLGDKSATFTGGAATIALAQKDLKVGRNVFKGQVVPKGKPPQDVELAVAIPFLVHPSLAPLEKGESKIDVVFELADDQKAILVDGEKLEGKTYEVEIPAPTEEARIFDKTVNYEVQPKSGPSVKGSLKLAIPYASLRVGLPGRRPFAIGEEVEVSGHTSSGGAVHIGETTLTADDAGVFKGKVKIGKDQAELKIRAFSAKLAAREATVGITHAKDAAEVVKILRLEAKTPFLEVAKKPEDHVGKVVSAKLVVAQTGEEDGRAIAVGEAKCGDAKCPAMRVLLPPGATAAKGDIFEVLGVVARVLPVEQGKETAVEIDASILIGAK